MNEIAKLTGMHMHASGKFCRVDACYYAPRIHNGHTRCHCGSFNPSPDEGFCSVCGAVFLADWEWDLLTGGTDGGFVESDSLASDAELDALRAKLGTPVQDFPVTVTVHTLDGKSFPVPGIREDSITYETRKDVATLVMERHGSDAIVYAPNVAYYVTVCE